MNIEVKKSKKPIKYEEAINFMESKILKINENTANELIWTLEHNEIFTAGTSFKENEILDKSIKIIRTNRGGKITYHGPGQLICYFIIDLKKRGKDIRKFISIIEKTIIDTIKFFKIEILELSESLSLVTPESSTISVEFVKSYPIHEVLTLGNRGKLYDL